jgi:RND family efflux transporter MFP subunit
MNKIKYLFPAMLFWPALYSCGDGQSKANEFPERPIAVKLATPSGGDDGDPIAASGTVEAVRSALIGTRMMGTITKMYVHIGDHVQQGQLLFTINASDIEARRGQASANMAQAEAVLVNAQKDYERLVALYKENSATAKELDNATLQYKAARAQWNAARQMRNEVNANLDYARVTAPFSGIITQKMMDAGSLASPGIPVLTLEQPGDLQVSATVSENNIGRIHTGAMADMRIASANRDVQGRVTQMSPSSAQTNGQYMIKISLPGNRKQGILPGMYVNVSFKGKRDTETNAPRIMIPQRSIVHANELSGIYTVSANNTALLRWIRTGKAEGDKIEVLSGLQPNEKFIEEAEGRLYNGIPVNVR